MTKAQLEKVQTVLHQVDAATKANEGIALSNDDRSILASYIDWVLSRNTQLATSNKISMQQIGELRDVLRDHWNAQVAIDPNGHIYGIEPISNQTVH